MIMSINNSVSVMSVIVVSITIVMILAECIAICPAADRRPSGPGRGGWTGTSSGLGPPLAVMCESCQTHRANWWNPK